MDWLAVLSGKQVTRLEYQAYTPLAMKTLVKILNQSHALPWSSISSDADLAPSETRLLKSIVIHRLGSVPVGETSIIIAVSSPHRREAFEACEWLLERVKKDVQVWKREWYAGSTSRQGDGDGDVGPIVAKDGEAGGANGEIDAQAIWKRNF